MISFYPTLKQERFFLTISLHSYIFHFVFSKIKKIKKKLTQYLFARYPRLNVHQIKPVVHDVQLHVQIPGRNEQTMEPLVPEEPPGEEAPTGDGRVEGRLPIGDWLGRVYGFDPRRPVEVADTP